MSIRNARFKWCKDSYRPYIKNLLLFVFLNLSFLLKNKKKKLGKTIRVWAGVLFLFSFTLHIYDSCICLQIQIMLLAQDYFMWNLVSVVWVSHT